jgi:type II secretory pathway component PulF
MMAFRYQAVEGGGASVSGTVEAEDRLFGMLQEMLTVLPLPTLILLKVSGFLHHYWVGVVLGGPALVGGAWYYFRTADGVHPFFSLEWCRWRGSNPHIHPVSLGFISSP